MYFVWLNVNGFGVAEKWYHDWSKDRNGKDVYGEGIVLMKRLLSSSEERLSFVNLRQLYPCPNIPEVK